MKPRPDAATVPEPADRGPQETRGLPPHNPPRRNFLTRILAMAIGGLILAVPLASGLALFFDPLLRSRRRTSHDPEARRDPEGYLRVASVAALPGNGRPQVFAVYDDVNDAWNKFSNQPIGRVFLRKRSDGRVTAFNVRCPHLGCAVDYRRSQNDYFCPCHTSAFNLDGEKENEIPPRGMDALDVKLKNGSEVWVRYQVFKAGTPDKIPV